MAARRFIGVSLFLALALVACDPASERQGKEMAPTETPETDPQAAEEVPEDAYEEAGIDAANDEEDHTDFEAGTSGGRLEAHEHGKAVFSAAVDGETLTLTFEAPLMSMVGFEHEAETPEQTEALNALKEAFRAPGSLVEINRSADCVPQMTSSGTHFSGGHGALEVEHVYTCDNPGELARIDFLNMGNYPGLASIDAVFVSDTQQAVRELTQSNAALEIP
ncbi:MAG: DUF2796 domain-containing protein [Henriciella sp.]|uniref:ZrgA family zinc uptake protein n=1 Tax=Henriciella sp. TaxID=1968823 RepID=UPI003C717B7F